MRWTLAYHDEGFWGENRCGGWEIGNALLRKSDAARPLGTKVNNAKYGEAKRRWFTSERVAVMLQDVGKSNGKIKNCAQVLDRADGCWFRVRAKLAAYVTWEAVRSSHKTKADLGSNVNRGAFSTTTAALQQHPATHGPCLTWGTQMWLVACGSRNPIAESVPPATGVSRQDPRR